MHNLNYFVSILFNALVVFIESQSPLLEYLEIKGNANEPNYYQVKKFYYNVLVL